MFYKRHSALTLFVIVLAFCGLGLVMLYSSSAVLVASDPQHFLKNQAAWLGIGLVAWGVMAWVDYRLWERVIWVLLAITVVALALCYVPGIGRKVNGASRWLSVGGLTMQPSEMAKITLLLFLGYWYGRPETRVHAFIDGFAIPMGVCSVVLGLILFEKDVGTTLLLGSVICVVCMVVGVRLQYLFLACFFGFSLIAGVVLKDPVRRSRMVAHLGIESGGGSKQDMVKREEASKKGQKYQQWQALIALGSGGVDGLGLGESRQKMYYVPEAHTDFIFSIIGEELGVKCTLGVVLAFIVYIIMGGVIAVWATDLNGLVLALGVTTLVGVQSFVNMGVVTDILPNKGLALPFISYGGSSLVACLAMTGLLMSVARNSVAESVPKAKVSDGVRVAA